MTEHKDRLMRGRAKKGQPAPVKCYSMQAEMLRERDEALERDDMQAYHTYTAATLVGWQIITTFEARS